MAEKVGYPVLVRPHYVLGGRGMRVYHSPNELKISEPSLVDQFLEDAIELDVDLLSDGENAWVAGILEHIEPAGVHSGDSACVVPGPSVTPELEAEVRELASALAPGLDARGLVNLQLAVKDRKLYVIEANPRASRTVPFIAKATGISLVHHACRLMLGASLSDLGLPEKVHPTRFWAKEAVFPDDRFQGGRRAQRGDEIDGRGHGRRRFGLERVRARHTRRRSRQGTRVNWTVTSATRRVVTRAGRGCRDRSRVTRRHGRPSSCNMAGCLTLICVPELGVYGDREVCSGSCCSSWRSRCLSLQDVDPPDSDEPVIAASDEEALLEDAQEKCSGFRTRSRWRRSA